MLTFEDARSDPNLYAVWLTTTSDPEELADQVLRILRAGGYTVPEAFAASLCGLPAIELADFKAANFPFESDDQAWLEHCRNTYATAPHPSETAVERNGARGSWRDRS